LRGRKNLTVQEVQVGSRELRELYGNRGKLTEANGRLMFNQGTGLVPYVPESLRPEILRVTHQTAHHSAEKLLLTLRQRFWWPAMRAHARLHVARCTACRRTRNPESKPSAPLQIFNAASLFELVHIDIMGGKSSLPATRSGNKRSHMNRSYLDQEPFMDTIRHRG